MFKAAKILQKVFPFENRNKRKCEKKNISVKFEHYKHSVLDLAKRRADRGPKAGLEANFEDGNGSRSEYEDNKWLAQMHREQNIS